MFDNARKTAPKEAHSEIIYGTSEIYIILGPLMEKKPLSKLTWHGHETIEPIPALLDQAMQIEITLPSNYNYALFRKLHLQAHPAEPEVIDALGGPKLLRGDRNDHRAGGTCRADCGAGDIAGLQPAESCYHASCRESSNVKRK